MRELASGTGRCVCLLLAGLAACSSSGGTPSTSGSGGMTASAGTSAATGGTAGGGAAAGNGGASGSPITAGASATGGSVSFARDVAPIFAGSCVYCHYTGSILVDIENPFAPGTGLVGSDNSWATEHPEGHTPAKNVAPGYPDQSFLLTKIGNPGLDTATAGEFMPWAVPRLTDDEITALRAWISAGAQNDGTFMDQIRPIFGTAGRLGRAGGKCTYCHFAGGQEPNLSDPFDPMTGAVGVASKAGQGLKRIEPGNPDASFLVVKVTSTTLPRAQGLPMPAHFDALSAAEVSTVRTWIQAGARND